MAISPAPVGSAKYVEPPAVTPIEGGIFDAATVLPLQAHESMGVRYELQDSGPAVEVSDDAANCIQAVIDRDDWEGFDFIESGPAFYVVVGAECTGLGWTEAEASQVAERRLVAASQRAVEKHLWETRFPRAAVDLTPAAGAVKPKVALGLLEEYAGTNYSFVPTVHAGRRAAVFLAGEDLVAATGPKAAVVGGAKFVNGAGYVSRTGPGGVVAGASEAWMYVTGEIVLREGRPFSQGILNTSNNRLAATSLREYVATIDGLVAAIRVTTE